MMEYRFKLEPYKGMNSRYHCPDCQHRDKTFTRYIDTETGEHFVPEVGKCNRESNCGYHYTPKQFFQDNRVSKVDSFRKTIAATQPPMQPVFIPDEVLKQTLKGYEQNTFIQNLLNRVPFPFVAVDVERIISMYYLGTICDGYRAGAITFPFIDKDKKIRAIQVKQFDDANHTLKNGTEPIHTVYSRHPYVDIISPIFDKVTGLRREILPNWIIEYRNSESKFSCLFGEHLLSKYPLNPIALVESPKTAIYGTLYFGSPEDPKNFLWLAVGALSWLKYNRCAALQGRKVVLFPDLSGNGAAFQKWCKDASYLEGRMNNTQFYVSDLLEKNATEEERLSGCDLADYLIKQDWRLFRKPNKLEETRQEFNFIVKEALKTSTPPKVKIIRSERLLIEPSESWNSEIAELEQFFKSISLPANPIKLNQCSMITNVSLFIQSHFTTVKANNVKQTFMPYLTRLQELKSFLLNQNANEK